MKYEPVFGDQSLFDGAGTFTGLDVVVHSIASGIKSYARLSDLTPESLRNHPVCAMRRIIAEPKRWTVEDKKAGRLPEVGSKAVSVHDFCVVDILAVRNRCVVVCNSDVIDSRPCVFTVDNFLEIFKPIETPEEKAQRLRDEWCNKALSSASILSGMQEYELKRLGGYIGDIYDALLSGELTMPSKDGE